MKRQVDLLTVAMWLLPLVVGYKEVESWFDGEPGDMFGDIFSYWKEIIIK